MKNSTDINTAGTALSVIVEQGCSISGILNGWGQKYASIIGQDESKFAKVWQIVAARLADRFPKSTLAVYKSRAKAAAGFQLRTKRRTGRNADINAFRKAAAAALDNHTHAELTAILASIVAERKKANSAAAKVVKVAKAA